MKIINVVGARPNFMKIAPLIREMNRWAGTIEHILVHTGQHYDNDMSDNFFKQLEIPEPNINLGIGGGSQSEQTARIMIEFEKVVLEERPDLVVVVGDVNSTIACSVVSSKLGVKIAHVEAGLRSFDRSMPEEINRVLTDAISDYLFTTESAANENLRREGISDKQIYFVGNVMIDTLVHCLSKIERMSLPFEDLQEKQYAVVTVHRPSNVDRPEIMRKLLEALSRISQTVKLFIPLHPRTKKNIAAFGMDQQLIELGRNAMITGPIGYLEMLRLIKSARLVITDSGGIQEETTYLGVPCITMRDNTERPSTVEMGTNVLVGNDLDLLLNALRMILAGEVSAGRIPPLWDGRASERIVATLLS